MKRWAVLLFATVGFFLPHGLARPESASNTPVTLIRVPGQGIQPQVALDRKGAVHLVYFAAASLHVVIFSIFAPPIQARLSLLHFA